jgi:hypothetical protein
VKAKQRWSELCSSEVSRLALSRFFLSCRILLEWSLRVASSSMVLSLVLVKAFWKRLCHLDQGPTLPRAKCSSTSNSSLSGGSQSSAPPSGGCRSISLKILGRPFEPHNSLLLLS